MSVDRRPRGRPRGSCKDDLSYLRQVADLVVRESLKPTTAMKRVIASRKWLETEPTLVRRWQTKWKLQGESLLVSARASLAAESAKHRRTAVTGFSAQELSRLSNLARGIEPSAWALLTREMKNSPWAKLSKKLNESPWAKLTREAQASPWERLAREHFSAAQNFHDMQRKINDAIDPPYLRELRRIGKS